MVKEAKMQYEACERDLQALQVPTLYIDCENRIIVCNLAAQALLGAGAVGRHYVSILRQPPILNALDAVIRTGTQARANFIGNKGHRETIWIANAARLMAGGKPGVLLSFEDTTEMQEAG